jgi:hypothetical protein
MGMPIASFILGIRKSVSIETSLPRADALARLSANVVPWGYPGLRGIVSESGVSLYVVDAIVGRKAVLAVFDGKLEATSNGSALVGTIGLDSSVRLTEVVLVLAALVVFARELIGMLRGLSTASSLLTASRWLLVLPAAAAFNFIVSIFSSRDEQQLISTLHWTLRNHVG